MREQPGRVQLRTPLSKASVAELRAGQVVALSGVVYTARDAAHQRLAAALAEGRRLPVDLAGAVIYYCGPAPAPPGRPAGSCGPTTSARMDPYTEAVLEQGVAATIGKGNRSRAVRQALVRHGAVYLVAVGGAGALLARHVRAARVVAYEDLGPEAIHEFEVEDLPAVVGYDAHGGAVFAGEEPPSARETSTARSER